MPDRTEPELLTPRLRLRLPAADDVDVILRVATEAVTAAVHWTVRQRPADRIVARIRPENTASARVAAKAGLVRAPELDTDGEDGPDELWILPPG